MKKEEIIQNNKLIAEFDGRVNTMCHNNTTASPYDYEKSWDWLMPIIEKIEGLGFEVLIGRISCNINKILDRENPIASFVCGDISRKIEIVYDTVIEFINWYNKNKQS